MPPSLDLAAQALASAGYECHARTLDGGVPALWVRLEGVGAPDLILELLYRPDTGSPDLQLLQAVTELRIPVGSGSELAVSRFVLALDAVVALPGFGFQEKQRALYYRYVAVGGREGIPTEQIVSVVELIHLLADTFHPLLSAVASGAMTPEEARAEIPQRWQRALTADDEDGEDGA